MCVMNRGALTENTKSSGVCADHVWKLVGLLQRVERAVDLDRRQPADANSSSLRCGSVGRVEGAAPRRVAPARDPGADGHAGILSRQDGRAGFPTKHERRGPQSLREAHSGAVTSTASVVDPTEPWTTGTGRRRAARRRLPAGSAPRPAPDAAQPAPRRRRPGLVVRAGRQRLAGHAHARRPRDPTSAPARRRRPRDRLGSRRGARARRDAGPARRAGHRGRVRLPPAPASCTTRTGACPACGSRAPANVLEALGPGDPRAEGGRPGRAGLVAHARAPARDPGARPGAGDPAGAADAGTWRTVPVWDWRRAGVDQHAPGTVQRAATVAPRLQECVDLPIAEARPAAADRAGHRGVDRGRGRVARARRRRRRLGRRLPPRAPRRLGAHRSADRRRRHARAAGRGPATGNG